MIISPYSPSISILEVESFRYAEQMPVIYWGGRALSTSSNVSTKKLFLFNQAMTRCQVDGTQTVEVFGSFVRYLDLDMMEIH